MDFVRSPESLDVIGVRTLVDLHKMRDRLFLVAEKLRSADVDNRMARMAHRDNVLEFLDGVFLVVTPPFVRFEPFCRSASNHTFAFRSRVSLAADNVPLSRF